MAAGFQRSGISAELAGVYQTEQAFIEAEKELMDEIRRIYLSANVKYQMKHYAEADRLFGDCYALFLASADYLSEPEKLGPMADDCERRLESLAELHPCGGVCIFLLF